RRAPGADVRVSLRTDITCTRKGWMWEQGARKSAPLSSVPAQLTYHLRMALNPMRLLAVSSLVVAAIAACGSEGSTFDDEGGGGGGGGGGGFGNDDGGGGGGGGDPSDASLSADSACAQASAQATLKPLDMFIMFDASISMGPGDCNVGQS